MKKKIKQFIGKLGYIITKTHTSGLQHPNPFLAAKSKIGSDDVILFDIGANRGQTIDKMKTIFPVSTLYAFEPGKKCFSYLNEKYKAGTGVNIVNAAAGSQSGLLDFNEYSWDAMNSLLNRAYGSAKIVDTYQVEVLCIDDFSKAHQVNHIHILKTDTEGYELHVLKGASQMMRDNKIQFVLVEVFFNENYINQDSFGDIYNFLLINGFNFVRFYDVLITDDGIASKTDALFYNPNFNVSSIESI